VLEILLIKVERSAIANHAIVSRQRYSRELVDFVVRNTCPNIASQLTAAEKSPLHENLKQHIVAGKRHPEFECIIDNILANPRSASELTNVPFKFLLVYMCHTHEKYECEHLKKFVGICLDNGVDERDLREAVFLKVVGNPNI
jgi:hypothetical protein